MALKGYLLSPEAAAQVKEVAGIVKRMKGRESSGLPAERRGASSASSTSVYVGKINSGSGNSYSVTLYDGYLGSVVETVTVAAMGFNPLGTIPSGTWVTVIPTTISGTGDGAGA